MHRILLFHAPGNICFHLLKILFPPIENKFSHSGKFIFSEWEQMKIFYLFLIPTKGILASLRLSHIETHRMENRINHIIARVLSGESSSDDILSLSEWLNENEKNRDEFRRLKNYWDADVAFKHSVAPAFSADKLQQKINVQRRQTARRQLWRNAIPLIAAACLLFFLKRPFPL